MPRAKKLNVLILVNQTRIKLFNKIKNQWKKSFKVNVVFDLPINIEKYVGTDIDILFLDDFSVWKLEYYLLFKNSSKFFKFSFIKSTPDEKDVIIYKKLADAIIYDSFSFEHVKWQTIANLRGYQDAYVKAGVKVHKGIIADFLENCFVVDKNRIFLTPKEAQLLKYFMSYPGIFMSKKQIFNDVWGHSGYDYTRAVDQMIFKLKNKIGQKYFTTKRQEGICFS